MAKLVSGYKKGKVTSVIEICNNKKPSSIKDLAAYADWLCGNVLTASYLHSHGGNAWMMKERRGGVMTRIEKQQRL
jgi:hypothetical protein